MALLSQERIVHTAKQIVRTEGHTRLSVRGLARQLDVTAPAIYDHMESKEAVLRAVAASGYEELRAAYSTTADSAIERMRERALTYVEFARTNPELFSLMFMFRPNAIAIEADNELGAATDVFETGVDDVRQAISDGSLVDRDPIQITLTLWAAIHGVATVSIMAPFVGDAVAADVIDAMLAGLRPN
ncbi:MAG: AcrR family transcriptional regulator [Ilumatobacter sp.]|jgi:AcrR family transcriptional regulator